MRIVLSEEEYMERLSSILKRDYFPSLLELENELSCSERLSLSSFQSNYTTEDNASFEELLERENKRKRDKFERVFGGSAELVDDPSRRLLLQDSKKYQQTGTFQAIENGKIRISSSSRLQNPTIKLENTRFSRQKGSDVPLFDSTTTATTIGNNEFVPTTPNFDPDSSDFTPIFTFGDVVSTPQRLANTPNKFRVPPTPVREAIAHSLSVSARKANAKKSSSSKTKDLNRTPTTVSEYSLQDLKGLTPKRNTKATAAATESETKPKLMITKKK